MGYVGLPLVREFLNAGFPVLGFDIDEKRTQMLQEGESYIKHVDSGFVKKHIANNWLRVASDHEEMKSANALILCISIPSGRHMEPDLYCVLDTTREIAKGLRRGQGQSDL